MSELKYKPRGLNFEQFEVGQELVTAARTITEADLVSTFHIQGYTVTGMHAVYQVVEHFGMHLGQILYVTKLVRGESLGFYRELDKTGRA